MFEQFAAFVDSCPTPFHFTAYARTFLTSRGFIEVPESSPSPSPFPSLGFTIRDDRSLFAWRDNGHSAATLISSHCDSPCFILKRIPECPLGTIPRLRCSTYGGGLWHSWVDRPLRLAGQVIYDRDGIAKTALFDSKTAFGVFPSTAIHFGVGSAWRPTFDLEDGFVASYGISGAPGIFEAVAAGLGVEKEKILYSDLRFVSADPASLLPGGLISSPRLDNLSAVFGTLTAFVGAEPARDCLNCLVVLDTEEIGGLTKNGAHSGWINECLSRIVKGEEELRILKARTVGINVDAMHAAHPNWPAKNDRDHEPIIGGGIAVERDPPSDLAPAAYIAVSEAVKRTGKRLQIAAESEVVASSADDGPLIETLTGIAIGELGIPLLAMHGVKEFGSIRDIEDLVTVLTDVYANPPIVLD
jgi:aspartyl aminopeptidase